MVLRISQGRAMFGGLSEMRQGLERQVEERNRGEASIWRLSFGGNTVPKLIGLLAD